MKGFNCHKKGHVPHSGWKENVFQNDEGHFFMHRVCRNCHGMYIEFISGLHQSPILDSAGTSIVTDHETATH